MKLGKTYIYTKNVISLKQIENLKEIKTISNIAWNARNIKQIKRKTIRVLHYRWVYWLLIFLSGAKAYT